MIDNKDYRSDGNNEDNESQSHQSSFLGVFAMLIAASGVLCFVSKLF